MTMRTVFCVQCYAGMTGPVVKGRLWQFGTADEADRAADLLEGRVAGFVVFGVSGEPDFGAWEEPVVLRTYGRLPEDASTAAEAAPAA